jgi:hypothetical protein
MNVNTLLPAFFTLASHRGGFVFFVFLHVQQDERLGFACRTGVCLYELMSSSSQKEACIQHTGELAAAVLVATSTHMDLTGVTACWPVLTGIQPRYEKVITRVGL